MSICLKIHLGSRSYCVNGSPLQWVYTGISKVFLRINMPPVSSIEAFSSGESQAERTRIVSLEEAHARGLWWLADALVSEPDFEADREGTRSLNGSIQALRQLVGDNGVVWGPWVNGDYVDPGGHEYQFGVYRVGLWVQPIEGVRLLPRDSRDHRQILRIGLPIAMGISGASDEPLAVPIGIDRQPPLAA